MCPVGVQDAQAGIKKLENSKKFPIFFCSLSPLLATLIPCPAQDPPRAVKGLHIPEPGKIWEKSSWSVTEPWSCLYSLSWELPWLWERHSRGEKGIPCLDPALGGICLLQLSTRLEQMLWTARQECVPALEPGNAASSFFPKFGACLGFSIPAAKSFLSNSGVDHWEWYRINPSIPPCMCVCAWRGPVGWAVGAVPWELPGAQFPGEKRGKKIKSWGAEGKIPGEEREKSLGRRGKKFLGSKGKNS